VFSAYLDFCWQAINFRVTLCAGDYAAHTSAYLDQGTVADDVYGRLLRPAVGPIPYLQLKRAGSGTGVFKIAWPVQF
jgi:hypothetical protein